VSHLITGLLWQGVSSGGGGGGTPPANEDVILSGVPRAMISWRSNTGTPWLAVGTHTNVYAYNGALTVITPAGLTAGDADAGFGEAEYGAGVYGVGVYGIGDTTSPSITPAGVWQLDSFGQYLVACLPGDGDIYSWDLNVSNDLVAVTNAPTGCVGVVVTPERFLVALGAGSDGRSVAWADQETLTTWTPAATNSAGDFPLSTVGSLVCGRRGRGETLLWTDVDLWAMRYIGGTLVYSFERVGTNCGIIAGQAVATLDGVAYWMGTNGFFAYDGYVQDIPCDVSDYVFSEFNALQSSKCHAVAVSAFNEVWFFYPSYLSQEIDRYVIYNTKERHWSIGTLSRTCGVDAGAFGTPIMAAPDGALYEHEKGWSHGGAVPYATSGPMELGAGDQVMMVRRVIPDEKSAGDAQVTFEAKFYPNADGRTYGPYSLGSPTDVRFMGRQVAMTVEEVKPGPWRIGTFRLDVVAGGER
jgi:hypothetical protein